jgi:hypothetical protein
LISPLNCNSNNGFTSGTAASFAGFLAADEKFIYVCTPGESFTIMANGATAQLLEPDPCRAAAAEAQQLFEINCIDPGFWGCEPPHGFKPVCDWLFGAVVNGSGQW